MQPLPCLESSSCSFPPLFNRLHTHCAQKSTYFLFRSRLPLAPPCAYLLLFLSSSLPPPGSKTPPKHEPRRWSSRSMRSLSARSRDPRRGALLIQRCCINFCETNRLKTLQQVETLKEYRLGVSESAYLVVLSDPLWLLCKVSSLLQDVRPRLRPSESARP